MAIPAEIQAVYHDETPAKFATRVYCVSCVAHRLLKFGWEPQVNSYGPRMLLLLALHLPIHARLPVLKLCYQRALELNDERILALMRREFDIKETA
jgi:hypothetical protein